jgi:tetratricopeptide (TPR) repeat protein
MADMIEVACPTCGTPNPVGETAVGTQVVCSTCRSRFVVPAKPAGRGALELSLSPGGGSSSEGDLPAPKRATAVASLDLDDLLGPAGPGAHEVDLPAPRLAFEPSRRGEPGGDVTDLPAPKRGLPAIPGGRAASLAGPDPAAAELFSPSLDLPAPVGTRGGLDSADLPAPRRPGAAARANLADLPAPRGPAAPAGRPVGSPLFDDLPAPRPAASAFDNLPAPRGPGITDLPAPRAPGLVDLPTPKQGGFGASPAPSFDDLPVPRPGGFSELPAPRPGGFSELPAPRAELPPELPVPKGFFDDLPQPAAAGATPSEIAPKGLFDDLPKPADLSASVAPKGFFDDLPGRAQRPSASQLGRSRTPSAPGSLFDDIPVPSGDSVEDLGLRTPRTGAPSTPPLDLGSANPSIDLGLPPPSRPSSSSIPPLLGSSPGGLPRAGVPSIPGIPGLSIGSGPGLATDPALIDDRPPPRIEMPRPPAIPAPPKARDKRKTKLALFAVLGVLVLGAAGTFGYRHYAAAQERKEQIAEGLTQARRALIASEPGHWQRAASAAKRVLALDESNSEAIGLGAEVSFASAIDDGHAAVARIRAGKQLLAKAAAEAITTPPISRARALSALTSGNAEHAVTQLRALMPDPNAADANLRLYFAWAEAARGDAPAAIAAFDQALAAANPHKISALYGRAQVRLIQGELAAARTDFAAVLELDKEHLGAQVGLAAALPSAQAQQRESDLLAILQRKDLADKDPRALALAWRLAGDEARRGGRLEAAAERYRKGLEIMPDDVAILMGLAQLELANGRAATARETIDKVLGMAANDLGAILVAAEVDLAQNQLDSAGKRLDDVRSRKPAHPFLQARLAQLSARLLETAEDYEGALKLYRDAIKLAGEADLGPTMATVALLTKLADRADGEDAAGAAAHRAEIEILLEPLTKRAAEDSSVAVTLGAAYLAGGNAQKAEEWLSRAATQRPEDADAKLQLARAMSKLNKVQASIDLLTKAFAANPERADIGAELARSMESANRSKDAAALYEKLLESPTVPVSLRAHAGRFLARQGQIERAAAQGEAILAAMPDGDAAGYYLRGLGSLHAKKLDDARRDLQRAANLDHDPEYLDALGRATEQLWHTSADTRFLEESLRAYSQSAEIQPTASSLHGLGRLYLERREAPKALTALLQANQLDGADADILYRIGVSYQELHQYKAAVAWLERSLEGKSRAEAEYRLGLCQLELEQGARAAAALTRATSTAVTDEKKGEKVAWLTEAFYLLGRVEHDRRNDAAARRAWESYLARNPSNLPQVDEVKRLLR